MFSIPFFDNSWKKSFARLDILSSLSSILTAISFIYPLTYKRFSKWLKSNRMVGRRGAERERETFIISFNIRWEMTSTAFFLTDTEGSRNRAYIYSVQGSKRFGKRTAKSPRAIVQLDRTVSEGALSATVNRIWRFASLKDEYLMWGVLSWNVRSVHNYEQLESYERKNTYQNSASMIISLQRASIAEAWRSGN
jgi:hypothetical protein